MKKDLIFLFGGLLGCCVLALLAIAPSNSAWVQAHQGGAAWVQAAFSILAIYVALIYPRLLSETQQQSEHLRNRKLLAELIVAADELLTTAANASDTQESAIQYRSTYNFARWTSMRDALSAFPIVAFNSANEARDLMEIRSVMVESVDLIAIGEKGYSVGPNPHLQFVASLGRIRLLRAQIASSLQRLKATEDY